MQLLVKTSSAGTAYTAKQVAGFLANPNQIDYVFDLLGPDGRWKADLTPYIDTDRPPEVVHDATRVVKRTLNFTARSGSSLNALKDIVRPHFRLLAPDGGWLDWALGTFLLMPPPERVVDTYGTLQNFQGADLAQIFIDSVFLADYQTIAGATVTASVAEVVRSAAAAFPFQILLVDTGSTIALPLPFPAGDTRIRAINDVLAAKDFLPIFFDELGALRSSPKPDFSAAPISFTFDLDNSAIGLTPISDRKDLTSAYNQILVLGQNPAGGKGIKGYYENNNPLSPISTVNWRPKLLTIRDSKITDEASANARAFSEAQKAARIYGRFTIATVPWPVSQDYDVYGLLYTTTDEGTVSARVLELGWTHRCAAGEPTIHEVQRVLPI